MVKLKNGNIIIPNFSDLSGKNNYELEYNGDYQSNGYYSRVYLLKCRDYRNVDVKANYINITFYYCHKEYEMQFALYSLENGVGRFTDGESFRYRLAKNTDRFSMVQIDELLKILDFNFNNFIHCIKTMNNRGIEV